MKRLDQFLDENDLCRSRARARDAILRGCVTVNGRPAAKAGLKISDKDVVEIDDPTAPYVSRAALKLLAGIKASGIEVTGKTCLDLGASTGGFTQVLLEQEAETVFAVDVGRDQLAAEIKTAPQVVNLENTNATLLSDEIVPKPIELLVSDISFVSLTKVIAPALALCTSGADALLLVKPQFEVGREKVGKGGIVKDIAAIEAARRRVDNFVVQQNWEKRAEVPSPIAGGDGNQEFIHWYRKVG